MGIKLKLMSSRVFPAEFPDDLVLENGIVYISEQGKTAKHLCPCGCGSLVVTPFDKPKGWSVKLDANGPTIFPSIGNFNFPCRSHYFITDGNVIWCD